jgi:type IV pilus assembly protein PilM
MAGFFKKKPKQPADDVKQPSPGGSGAAGSGSTENAQEKPKKQKKQKKQKKPLFSFGKKPEDRKPKEKKPKDKKPKDKKPKDKKPREKKPLFAFGKKKKAGEGEPGDEAKLPPQGKAPSAAGEPAGEGKGPKKKGLFARKPKKPAKLKIEDSGSKKKKTFGGSKYSPVGLDLGRSSISAARLKHQTEGSVVISAAIDQLPEGIISEGEVIDVDALGNALKNFWKSYKIRGRKVALGLASQKIVVRTLDFPALAKKELRQAIEFQAQDYIPIPIEDAVFDFHVIRRFTDEDGVEKQKVLVVAAQKAMVMNYIDAVKKARLTIDGIDLQAFAMLRSFSTRSFLDEGTKTGQALAIVNIASDVTNMVVEANGEPQFTRIISFGGDDFTRAVQEQTGVPFIEAETLKAQTGLPAPGAETAGPGPDAETGNPKTDGGTPTDDQDGEDRSAGDDDSANEVPPQGGDFLEGPASPQGPGPSEEQVSSGGDEGGREGDGRPEQPERPEEEATGAGPDSGSELSWPEAGDEAVDEEKELKETVQRALELTADSFADELRRSLDYYLSQEESLPIGRLLLSGGGALLPNLDRQLSHLFTFPVELGDPLVRIAGNKSDLSDEDLKALAPRLAIAIGLALEDEE